MPKLTKSPPASPSRRSFFGSSTSTTTPSLIGSLGPSRPVVQKRPDGRWTIVRVRTPRVEVQDGDEESDGARERREAEGRGYEGMIRPLYLGAGAGSEGNGGAVDKAGRNAGESGGRPGLGALGAARKSSEAVVPTLSALQAAMLNPIPPHPSSTPAAPFSQYPGAHGATYSSVPPVPQLPDAYRDLAPRSPSPTRNASLDSQRYPLSEYADETARSHSHDHGEARQRHHGIPAREYTESRHDASTCSRGRVQIDRGVMSAAESSMRGWSSQNVRLPDLAAVRPVYEDEAPPATLEPNSEHMSVLPIRPLPSPPIVSNANLKPNRTRLPITPATHLERNPSSSTSQTLQSDTDPPTEEDARLETPPTGVLLDADKVSFHWSEEAAGACSSKTPSLMGIANREEPGRLHHAEQYTDCGMAGVGAGRAFTADALTGPFYQPDSASSSQTSPRTLGSPKTAGTLSHIDWEGDLNHRHSLATLATATQSNDNSQDSSTTITPTKIPLSTLDGHGEVSRTMRPRAGSTGAQSTAMSLYSIGGFLTYESREPASAGAESQARRRERSNSEGSITSSYLLGRSPIHSSPRLDREGHQGEPARTFPRAKSHRANDAGRGDSRGLRNTFGPTDADVDIPTSDKDTDAEEDQVRRKRRSSVRHPYEPPARRAPPPPTFYIQETPPPSPSTQPPVAATVPTAPSTPTTPSRAGRMKRFMLASVVSLPAGASPVGLTDDAEAAHHHPPVTRARRLSTPTSGRRIRGLLSPSVISLPSAPSLLEPHCLPAVIDNDRARATANQRDPRLLGPILNSALKVKRSTSAVSVSVHQEAANDKHAKGMIKSKPSLKIGKKVSISPNAEAPVLVQSLEERLRAVEKERKADEKRQQQQQQQQKPQNRAGGGLGEIWRRMSAGRKGRKSKSADVPVERDEKVDEWGKAATPTKTRPLSAADEALMPPAAIPVPPVPAVPIDRSMSSRAREIRRKSVPAYHVEMMTDSKGAEKVAESFVDKKARRRSMSSIKAARAVRVENTLIAKKASRPAIRISTLSSSTPQTAPLPPLPSPLTMANTDPINAHNTIQSASIKDKDKRSGSPLQSRRRTGSDRHSVRALSSVDRQKEAKRRYRRTLIEIEDDVLFQQVVGDLSRLDLVRPSSLDQAGPGGRVSAPLSTTDVHRDARDRDASAQVGGNSATSDRGEFRSVPSGSPVAATHRSRKAISTAPSGAYGPWSAQSMRSGPASAATLAPRATEIPDPTSCGVQAWFVMRELVQGERRHGRLLARGIAISKQVAAHLLANEADAPPVTQRAMVRPTSLVEVTSARSGDRLSALRSSTFAVFDRSWTSSAQSSSVNLALDASLVVEEPTTLSILQPKKQESDSDVTIRRSVSFSRITLSRSSRPEPDAMASGHLRSGSLLSSASTILMRTARDSYRSSIDILLLRLPRLLALSLTLSSRFAHDPSPDQIATAFLSMEDELTTEMAGWAADVGILIGSGVGREIDRLRRANSSGYTRNGRATSASPAQRTRASLPVPGVTEWNTASSNADRVALEALADSTSLMPRMGRAHSYTAMPKPLPGTPAQSQPQQQERQVVASPTSIGSSISNFIGFGSSTPRSRANSTAGRDGQYAQAQRPLHPAASGLSSARASGPSGDGRTDESDKSSFSDVIMAPVQRVARYRMLFSTLVRKLDESSAVSAALRESDPSSSLSRAGTGGSSGTSDSGHTLSSVQGRYSLVRAALEASERVLQSVNAAQDYDLGDLRMPDKVIGGTSGKPRSKSRLRVMSWHPTENESKGVKKADSTGSGSSKASESSGAAGQQAGQQAQSTPMRHGSVEAGIDVAYKRHRSRLASHGSGRKSKEPKSTKESVRNRKSSKGEVRSADVDAATPSGQGTVGTGSPVQATSGDKRGGVQIKIPSKEQRSWRASTGM